jgi:hypothetical protein
MALHILLDRIAIRVIASFHSDRMRMRPDEGHVNSQRVDGLRKLAQAQAQQRAQDGPIARHPRVVERGALSSAAVYREELLCEKVVA